MSEDITISNNSAQALKDETEQEKMSVIKADPSRKRVTAGRRRATNRVPDEILYNKDLIADMAVLPSNYNFEVGLVTCFNNNMYFKKYLTFQLSKMNSLDLLYV